MSKFKEYLFLNKSFEKTYDERKIEIFSAQNHNAIITS